MLNIGKYRLLLMPMGYRDRFLMQSLQVGKPAQRAASQFMNFGIQAMWQPIPRIAGIAYTVKCHPGDNLMLHAAIYRAKVERILQAK